MFIYIAFLFETAILAFFLKNKKKTYSIIVGISLFLLLVLRSNNVGADLYNYYIRYDSARQIGFVQLVKQYSIEPLFALFLEFCSYVSGGNFRFFLFVCAAFFSIFFTYSIYRLSSKPFISWYFAICFSTLVYCLSGLRSSFGLIFGLMACVSLFNDQLSTRKKIIFFSCWYLLAVLFHYTAIIFIFVPIFIYLRRRKYYYYFYLAACILFYFVINESFYTSIASVFFPTKYYEITSTGGYGGLMICFLIRIGIAFLVRQEDKKSKEYHNACSLIELCFLCQILSIHFGLWSRITSFVLTLSLIYLPNCFTLFRFQRNSTPFIVSVVCVLLFAYYLVNLRENSALIVPYEFLWESVSKF